MDTSKIGRDEWVAQAEARLDRRRARWDRLLNDAATINPLVIVGALGLAAVLVAGMGSSYVLRIAALACVMATLALGLSIGVGFVGLLDLGYIAFAGIGGYTYALLSSNQLGMHTPSWAGLALAMLFACAGGLLLGLPALRLGGDHLAIVTLGFAQVFLLLALNLNRVALPWLGATVDVTGGPNGVVGVAGISVFGLAVSGPRAGVILLAAVLNLIFCGLSSLDRSPLGHAWRAIRENELAALTLGIPARRLKLLAVALGAAVAGLSGALYASWQGAVFPSDYGLDVLLMLYAMLLFGGLAVCLARC